VRGCGRFVKILFDQELIINERPRGSLCSIPRRV
jgi:hypothetical protein